MINSKLQYRITKTHAQKFEKAIELIDNEPKAETDNKRLLQKVFRNAVESQYTDLIRDMKEYKSILAIERSIGVKYLKNGALLDHLTKKLKTIGINQEFFNNRIVPKFYTQLLNEGNEEEKEAVTIRLSTLLRNIFGWSYKDLFERPQLKINKYVFAQINYKLPSHVDPVKLSVYTFYAHYLSLLVLQVTSHMPQCAIPTSGDQIRENILKTYGIVNYENLLQYIWSIGVPVLPLNDEGAFHGACWRENGRNVIVLKQKVHTNARWFYDLAHELYHAGQSGKKIVLTHIDVVDNKDVSINLKKEEDAGNFAGELALGARAEDLAQQCVTEAKGKVEHLKSVLPIVAKNENVNVGLLANYMAYRLSLQSINWWGAATNLQREDKGALDYARKLFISKVNMDSINDIDRQLLLQALTN